MNFQRFLCLFLVLFACLLSSSHCYTFYVGGKEGWVLQPKEKYNDWAGRMRFQVNDTLIFKYEKGSDSVLLVKKDGYDKCERKGALMEMSDGNSEYQFPHSGPFYFISGKDGHCQKGQKLITVVMAVRHGGTPAHGPIAKPPTAQPPKGWHPGPIAKPPKGSSPSYGPAVSPYPHGPISVPPTASSPGPSSTHHAPQYGPSQSPMAHGPISVPPTASSPAPSSVPTISPSPSTHHVPGPQYGPSQSPMAQGPTGSTPSPQASTPSASSPSPSTTTGPVSGPPAPPQGPSPSTTTPPSGSQGQVPSGTQTGTPAGGSTPGPTPSNSSATTTYSSVMVLVFSVLFSMLFGGGF